MFEHEYDLTALQWVQPRGHAFGMYVTPRYRHHYGEQEYERYTARLLSKVLSRCRLFVDVGANYGFYSLLAATAHPKLEVLALEPVAETSQALQRSLEKLNLPNLHVHQVAAGATDGEAQFHISVAADSCGFSPHPAGPPLRQIQVPVTRLDTLLSTREPCPTLVKVDVEGHELDVLRGMSGTLARYPDLTLLLELNPKMLARAGTSSEALLEQLEALGFAVFLLDDQQCRPARLRPGAEARRQVECFSYVNIYCVRKETALNLCFFSHSPWLAGAERSLVQLVDELTADHGALCSVVVPGEGPLLAALEKAGAACVQANYGWWCAKPPETPPPDALSTLEPQLVELTRDTLPILSEIDPDIVWTQTLVIPWGAFAAAVLRKPHIWSVCEYGERDHDLRFFAPLPAVLQDVLGSSNFVYTCGRLLGQSLFPGAAPDKWAPLPRNVEIPQNGKHDQNGLFTRPGALRLGIFATLDDSKGQKDAIRATAEVVKQGMDVELLLAGYSEQDYRAGLRRIAAELGVADHVRFPGFLDDRFNAMRESDVILVCSRLEAFGRVGVEAMLLGKPVIYSASGGSLEYLADGETGLSYKPGQVDELAQAIGRLHRSPELRRNLGDRAQAFARNRFTRESYGGEVCRKIRSILASEPPAAAMPLLLTPSAGSALAELAREIDHWQTKAEDRGQQLDKANAALRYRENQVQELEREQDRLRRKLRARLALGRFLMRQKRSLGKRRAELRDVLDGLAVSLRLTQRLRTARRDAELLRTSGLVDTDWYRQQYASLTSRKTDAALHYVLRGTARGCDPNQLFDSLYYAETNPEIAAADLNPLVHYVTVGAKRGLQPNPLFNPGLYLEANPDVAQAGLDPLAHYLRTGMKEGRPLMPARLLTFGPEPELTMPAEVPDVRLIAFYLPQFHAIPENDRWWGKGFTEWTNVRRARPQFPGHYQPHVPHASLGYYDLNDPSVLERQAELARRSGIHGFCFHHYWFGGKRLLGMPVDRLLRTGKPAFPFCLCWANENWTRRWDGAESEVLIAQQHSAEDDERFIRHVMTAFEDKRYITVNGRPLLIVYRPTLLPEPAATFRRWREICRAEGFSDLYLLGAQSFNFMDPRPLGLDGAVEFPPHNSGVIPLSKADYKAPRHFEGLIFDYAQAEWTLLRRHTYDHKVFRGIVPSWDNTARLRERGTIFVRSDPSNYFFWLRHLVTETRARYEGDERMIFINAWNEWAEGCHLEPDQRYGFAYLNATRRAVLREAPPLAAAGSTDRESRRQEEPVVSG